MEGATGAVGAGRRVGEAASMPRQHAPGGRPALGSGRRDPGNQQHRPASNERGSRSDPAPGQAHLQLTQSLAILRSSRGECAVAPPAPCSRSRPGMAAKAGRRRQVTHAWRCAVAVCTAQKFNRTAITLPDNFLSHGCVRAHASAKLLGAIGGTRAVTPTAGFVMDFAHATIKRLTEHAQRIVYCARVGRARARSLLLLPRRAATATAASRRPHR
jgi:hypothetical protein